MSKILNEEIYVLKKRGYTYEEIADWYEKMRNIKVSSNTIKTMLDDYCRSVGLKIPKTIKKENIKIADNADNGNKDNIRSQRYFIALNDDETYEEKMKKLLYSGKTISGYYWNKPNKKNEEDAIRSLTEKLIFLAEHTRKSNSGWLQDKNFIETLKLFGNKQVQSPYYKYKIYVEKIINGNICKGGNIDLIKTKTFRDNSDMMVFALSERGIIFDEIYDGKVWNKYKNNLEKKVDRYFSRLHSIEVKQKNRKNNYNNKENNTNNEIER